MGPSFEIPGECSRVREGSGANWWGRGKNAGPRRERRTDSWMLQEEKPLRAAQRWASRVVYGNAK